MDHPQGLQVHVAPAVERHRQSVRRGRQRRFGLPHGWQGRRSCADQLRQSPARVRSSFGRRRDDSDGNCDSCSERGGQHAAWSRPSIADSSQSRQRARSCGEGLASIPQWHSSRWCSFVLVIFITIAFLATRYKRCSIRQDPRRVRQGGRGAVGALHPRRRRVHLAADPGLRVPERSTPLTIGIPLHGRAVAAEHPRQRAEHVHGRHQHRTRDHEQRGRAPARISSRTTSRAWRAKSSSVSCASRVASLTHRADQPGPREVPRRDPPQRRRPSSTRSACT